MIDLLAALVSPTFAASSLARILEYIVPAAQALALAILARRIGWTGLVRLLPGGDLGTLFAESGSAIVRASILLWLLASWTSLSTLVLEEGPRLAGLVVGTNATPEQLAVKMVALVTRVDDGIVFGGLDWATSASIGDVPAASDVIGALVAMLSALLAQIAAAAIVLMIALPKVLMMVCLAVGPLAIASHLADSQLSREFVEGWAETAASAMLALPVMAILVSFLSSAPLPEPASGAGIGSASLPTSSAIVAMANDLATLLVIGLMTFMVLPIAAGIIQGRPPSIRALFGLILAACLLPMRSLRTILPLRPVR